MEQPEVKKGTWITIGDNTSFNSIDGYVIDIYSDGSIGVGYYQNKCKAIKSDVVWSGEHWEFKCSDPNGSYLRASEEYIVKNGPPR